MVGVALLLTSGVVVSGDLSVIAGVARAFAGEPTPPVPTLLPPTSSPDPSPTQTTSPEPDRPPRKPRQDRPRPARTRDERPSNRQRERVESRDGRRRPRRGGTTNADRRRTQLDRVLLHYHPSAGAFDSAALVNIAAHLRALGWRPEVVQRRVFSPFIVAGGAAWSDTWGAPRYGPGPNEVRRHEGQDVFCDYGAPVLAAEAGTVEFAEVGLGGKVARVRSGDGGYWYYAHLSRWNDAELGSGDYVDVGDVIGFCGNTGNALTTPSHVHFGHYGPDGRAIDPHPDLQRWLSEARRRAEAIFARAIRGRVDKIDRLSAKRQFGDLLIPSSFVPLSDDALQDVLFEQTLTWWHFPPAAEPEAAEILVADAKKNRPLPVGIAESDLEPPEDLAR